MKKKKTYSREALAARMKRRPPIELIGIHEKLTVRRIRDSTAKLPAVEFSAEHGSDRRGGCNVGMAVSAAAARAALPDLLLAALSDASFNDVRAVFEIVDNLMLNAIAARFRPGTPVSWMHGKYRRFGRVTGLRAEFLGARRCEIAVRTPTGASLPQNAMYIHETMNRGPR